jgi:class 3 adenylate cyclase/tetratricopeptide (TPR) repeat protein
MAARPTPRALRTDDDRVSNVADWLRSIGLPQYVSLFEQQRIELDVLPQLADEDLKELGIPLGDRKRLRAAISGLADGASAKAPAGDATPGAERRQITVVFCDLIGSTELASSLDPEDLAMTMTSYHDCCKDVIERWGGHVAEFLGDGAVIYFGWPRAHEDDPERAVRAALELVESVGRLPVGPSSTLMGRAGVATGLVMVGETKSDSLAHREGVVGETPNLASRAQALATSGAVVITPGTRRLVGDRFDLETLGVHELRGIAKPVEVWRVSNVRAQSRFEARAGDRVATLVGRETELDRLRDAWHAALEGGPGSVIVLGEAGIGKSRLLEELVAQTATTEREVLRLECSPYHAATALLPFVDWIRWKAGIEVGSDERVARERLEALVDGFALERESAIPLLAPLLSLPLGEAYDPPRLSLKLQRRRTIELVIELVTRAAGGRPLLLTVEDVHAADATSLELLSHLVEQTRGGVRLLVMTARPSFAARFRRPGLERIELEPLPTGHTLELVEAVTGGKALPDAVRETILDWSDGVPLFVEELTRQLLESGPLRDAGERYVLEADLAINVPATLHDLLVARLDALGPAKATAQIAATLGRSFSLDLLRAVAPDSQSDVASDVLQLCAVRILEVVDDDPEEPRYAFRHALLREAAYHAQLKARRREAHRRVAHVLEERYPGVVESEPETLAHHLAESGEAQRAAEYLLTAGQKALHSSAVQEAITHLSRGVELVQDLPRTAPRDRTELRLQALLGTAYMHSKSWGAAEVETAYSTASRLSSAAESAAEGAWILWGIWVYHHVRGRVDEAYDAAGRIRELAASSSGPDAALIADMVSLQSCFYTGRFRASFAYCEAFLGAYKPERHRELADTYSNDLELVCLVHEAIGSFIVGRADQAAAISDRIVAVADELDHPYSVAWASTWGAVPDLLCGDLRRATERVAQGRRIAEENDYAYLTAMATMLDGTLRGCVGHRDAVDEIERGLEAFRSTGAEIVVPFFQTLRAELLVERDLTDEAMALLADARTRIERWGERWQEAETWRVEANALAARNGEPSAVESRFQRALEIAREHGALGWELRAATDFADYACRKGRPDEARALLVPVLEAVAGASDDAVRAERVLATANEQQPVG